MVRQLGVDSYIHVCNRGVKKLPIYRQKGDLQRLLLSLFYFNHNDRMPDHWKRELEMSGNQELFQWPEGWGERQPIISILAFNILSNHLHLIIKETTEGGTSKFMHRVSMAYSKFINEKYDESGSLFQGAFKSRVVEEDTDLRNLAVYVMVKNSFEHYPGGLQHAIKHFDDAYEWAVKDPFNSLGVYADVRESPIITKDLFGELFDSPESFKEFAREIMVYRLSQFSQELD